MARAPSAQSGDADYIPAWRKDVRAIGALLTGEAVARGIGQLAVLVTARVLGPDDFGLLAVALTVFGIAVVLADLGLGETAAARLTHREHGLRTFDRVVAPSRQLAASGIALVMLVAALVSWNYPIIAVSCLSGAAVPGSIAITARSYRARICGDFSAAARWNAVNGLGLWVGPLVGALVFRNAVAAIVGMIIALGAAALGAGATRWLRPPPVRLVSSWVRVAAPLLAAGLAVAVYTRIDRVFVAAAEGPAAAGVYAAAYNVVILAAVIGGTLQAGLLPRLIHEDASEQRLSWRRRLPVVAAVATVPAALLALFAPVVIAILYGPQYQESVSILRWLSPLVVLYLTNPFLGAMLLSRRLGRAIAAVSMMGLVLALVLYPTMIALMGVTGAAVTSVGIEALGLVQASLWLLATDRRE